MARGSDENNQRYHSRREREEARRKTLPGPDDEPLPPPAETIRSEDKKPKRNEPCPCGSGKKYKQCCGRK